MATCAEWAKCNETFIKPVTQFYTDGYSNVLFIGYGCYSEIFVVNHACYANNLVPLSRSISRGAFHTLVKSESFS